MNLFQNSCVVYHCYVSDFCILLKILNLLWLNSEPFLDFEQCYCECIIFRPFPTILCIVCQMYLLFSKFYALNYFSMILYHAEQLAADMIDINCTVLTFHKVGKKSGSNFHLAWNAQKRSIICMYSLIDKIFFVLVLLYQATSLYGSYYTSWEAVGG